MDSDKEAQEVLGGIKIIAQVCTLIRSSSPGICTPLIRSWQQLHMAEVRYSSTKNI